MNFVCDFLRFLFDNGASSSSVNSARSALSFFLTYDLNVGSDVIISRLFKYFYKEKPMRPKYFTFWSVKDLLSFLSDLHPSSQLSLKNLTLKTLSLIDLTSSDRGQTIHLMDIENTALSEGNVKFVIFDPL